MAEQANTLEDLQRRLHQSSLDPDLLQRKRHEFRVAESEKLRISLQLQQALRPLEHIKRDLAAAIVPIRRIGEQVAKAANLSSSSSEVRRAANSMKDALQQTRESIDRIARDIESIRYAELPPELQKDAASDIVELADLLEEANEALGKIASTVDAAGEGSVRDKNAAEKDI